MKYIINITAKNGEIITENPKELKQYLLLHENKLLRLTLEKVSFNRSLNQNNWYWSCIVPAIAEHTGYTHNEAHEALKSKFLIVHKENPLPKVKSTALMTTIEFNEYCEEVRDWAAQELGIYIPDPIQR